MPLNDSAEYAVGYGKPPQKSQFAKGTSGNPSGRPKGRKNLSTILERVMRERVVINENGRRKQVTKLEAAIKQLVNQAASGDKAAIKQLTVLVASIPAVPIKELKPISLDEFDQSIVDDILKNLKETERDPDAK